MLPVVIGLLLLVIGAALVFLSKQKGADGAVAAAPAAPARRDEARPVRGGLDRMRAGARRRRNAAASDAAGGAAAGSGGESGDESGDEEDGEAQGVAKSRTTRKAAAKAEKKAMKSEARQADEAARTAKSAREATREEKQRQRDAEREEREQKEKEELEAVRKAQEEAEQAEFDKWKDLMSVDAGGSVEETLQVESQGLLGEFIEYIQEKKVVVLEELAAEFGLRTQEAIMRVQALESMGRLTGVMDERGKFIYVSEGEMKAVADFIAERGRVSIAELAERSRTLIQFPDPAEAGAAGKGAPEIDFDVEA